MLLYYKVEASKRNDEVTPVIVIKNTVLVSTYTHDSLFYVRYIYVITYFINIFRKNDLIKEFIHEHNAYYVN